MSKLLTKTKANKESYQELADTIGTLVSKPSPTASGNMIKILILPNYIDSIPDVELRTKIKLAKFKDVREAVMLACEIKAINQTEGARTKRPAVLQTRAESSTEANVRRNKPSNERKNQTNHVNRGKLLNLQISYLGVKHQTVRHSTTN